MSVMVEYKCPQPTAIKLFFTALQIFFIVPIENSYFMFLIRGCYIFMVIMYNSLFFKLYSTNIFVIKINMNNQAI